VDNQVVIYEYAGGARVTFHTNCMAALMERRMYICGSRGALRGDTRNRTLEFCPLTLRAGLDDSDVEDYYKLELGEDLHGHAGGDSVMGRELAATIAEGAPPSASIHEGLYSAVTALAADDAMATGQVVDIRPYWEKAGIDWEAARV